MPSIVHSRYLDLCRRNHSINLTRGRPAEEFLDLASGLGSALPEDLQIDGKDLRNYIGFPGLPAARELGAALLKAPADRVLVGDNSSMNLLNWVLTMLWFRGINGCAPWREHESVACLCPVPGYDRHFLMFDSFGIAMPTVPLTGEGPDMDSVEEIIAARPDIRALILVPRHSNPTGDVWSTAALERLLELAARLPDDFAIFCDNAYAVHDFAPTPDQPDLYRLAEQKGVLGKLFLIGSTSKLGYAGSGLSFVACSQDNLNALQRHLQGISPGGDPLAQARHAKFFRNGAGLMEYVGRLAPLWKKRFDIALKALDPLMEIPGVGILRPTGGYFLSVQLPPGTASRTVELAAEAGVQLSPAGSTFPGGRDPDDSNLRLAPTSPPLDQLADAMEIFAASAALAIEESR